MGGSPNRRVVTFPEAGLTARSFPFDATKSHLQSGDQAIESRASVLDFTWRRVCAPVARSISTMPKTPFGWVWYTAAYRPSGAMTPGGENKYGNRPAGAGAVPGSLRSAPVARFIPPFRQVWRPPPRWPHQPVGPVAVTARRTDRCQVGPRSTRAPDVVIAST